MTPIEIEIGSWANIIDFAVTNDFVAVVGRKIDNQSDLASTLKVYGRKTARRIPRVFPFNPEYLEDPFLILERKISVGLLLELDFVNLVQITPIDNHYLLLLFGNSQNLCRGWVHEAIRH
jgi:hypothetical protein